MKPFTRLNYYVAVLVAVAMILATLSLSGCKDKNSTGDPNDPTSVTDPSEQDGEEFLGEIPTLDTDPRVYPQGVLETPIADNIIRGAHATGGFEFSSTDETGAAVIPIDSVTAGTIIHVPITYDGMEMQLLAYGMEESDAYYVALGVSTLHGYHQIDGTVGSKGFVQIEHDGDTCYIACSQCGQFFRQDILGVDDAEPLMYCRPWHLSTEDCYLTLIDDTTVGLLGPYGWISSEETGEYSAGVSYVTPQFLQNTHAIVVPQKAVADAYATFLEWAEAGRSAMQVPDNSNSGLSDIPTVDNSGLSDIPVVDNNGLQDIPIAD